MGLDATLKFDEFVSMYPRLFLLSVNRKKINFTFYGCLGKKLFLLEMKNASLHDENTLFDTSKILIEKYYISTLHYAKS